MVPVDLNEYFERVMPFLRIGCSLHESCLEAQVPYSTCYQHYRGADDEETPENQERVKKDRQFRDKIDAAAQFSVTVARQAVFEAISGGKDGTGEKDPRLAFDYLRSKRRDEFAQKNVNEHEGEVKIDYGKEYDEEVERFSKPPDNPQENESVDDERVEVESGQVQGTEAGGGLYPQDPPAQTQPASIR